MDSLAQWGSGLLIVGGALLCGVLILIGGIAVAVFRSGLIGDVLEGLGGAVGGYEDDSPARPRRRSGASARTRAQAIRAQYDQEFDAQVGSDSDPGVPASPRFESGSSEPIGLGDEDSPDHASRARRRRRRRSELDDRDDEMDAYFDDMEL